MDSGGFPVTIKRQEVVGAVLPMQEHWLPMSNLDLLLPPLDFGIFLCYKNTENVSPANMVAALKKSLGQVLVSFSPLAGEILANGHGEPEILCNNRGVDFSHAYAEVDLKHVDFHRPDFSVHGKLVPVKTHGRLLSVQVTELKCGGLVVGCTFDHRAVDAHSANMFLVAWAEVAQSKRITLLPSFRRSLFNPRRPPQPDSSLDELYAPLQPPPPPTSSDGGDCLTSRIYYIESSEIDRLQSRSSHGGGSRRSKLESFSAFLWQTLAGAAADRSKTVKLGVVVDGRARLGSGAAPLESYFGNVLSIPYAVASAADLITAPPEAAADMVSACIATASTAEHFLSLIDWVEARRPKPAVVKVYCKDENDEAAVVVSSGRGFPVRRVDFGWGGPDLGSYHFPWGGETGYVMPMPGPYPNGDWIVYMHLKRRHLDLVEACAPHVFKPLSCEYLFGA